MGLLAGRRGEGRKSELGFFLKNDFPSQGWAQSKKELLVAERLRGFFVEPIGHLNHDSEI